MEIKESIFWNLVRILWQKKYIFIISIFSVALITFIITSLMPKTYKASLTFIINKEENGLGINNLLSNLPFKLGSGASSDADKYMALLGSRKIKDKLIKEFDLWNVYKVDYIEQLYKSIAKDVEFIDNMDGTITINTYYKRYPEKAAQMCKMVYDELYNLALKLKKEKSTNYRIYMEENLKSVEQRLSILEDSLKLFQIKYKVINFEEQIKISFKVLGELEAQSLYYKIERDVLKTSVAGNNPKQKEINQRLLAIKKSIDDLHRSGEKYLIAFDNMPNYGLSYFRLVRNITIQQELLKVLLPLVENAKIEEQKSTINIQIIDPPFVPQYKYKPKRLFYMVIVSLITGILMLLYFALMHAYRKNEKEIIEWIIKK